MLLRTALRTTQLALALLVAAYLIYLADHARQLLSFAYPLDYGEGPLLAQVEALRAGTPIWHLYADPMAPPYLVINYPPLYLLLCAALSPLTGSALLAGRLISLLAALATCAALALLSQPRRWGIALSLLFLTIPIVREWATLMRVDMLGLALGIWGLVALGRRDHPRHPLLAALLILASLFTKPSLIAAPIAAIGWLLWDLFHTPAKQRAAQWRTIITFTTILALAGGLLLALLQWASNGWFSLHVIAANANHWDADLAWGFWKSQIRLRWPLALVAALALVPARQRPVGASTHTLALFYTLAATITAVGVGKVGAYSNYFLELYTGLIWLIAVGSPQARPQSAKERAASGYRLFSTLLLIAALFYYPPLWDPTWPRQAGLLSPSPPRLALGRYGLWADAQREADLLAAFGRVDAALNHEVRAAGSIFSDLPGTAATAGVLSAMQVFEARQLLDQGLASQTALLVNLANGNPPLAVIDYLGNWLTPEIVSIIRHRYAQDGSLGTFDLYRPVEVGPAQALVPPPQLAGLSLQSFALAAPLSATYEPGELLVLNLHWRRSATPPASADLIVGVQLTTLDGTPLLVSEEPLVYGALPPQHWPSNDDVQHLQTLVLPSELPPDAYRLNVTLQVAGAEEAASHQLTIITVEVAGGQHFAETEYFVPAPIMQRWTDLGALSRIGLPLTPAVPFAWGRLQCFEFTCLELRNSSVSTRPLGSQLYLSETIRSTACPDATLSDGICAGYSELLTHYGSSLGSAESGELQRNGWTTQWTTQARLERRSTGEEGLGRLGQESLRLPPGEGYRWP